MKTMILLALIGLTGFAQAQTRVTGAVTNRSTGKPLEGATVTVIGGPATLTGANGQYRLNVPSQTTVILQASFLGFSTLRDTLQPGASSIDFALQETGLFVKAVEIASLRAGKNAPFTKSELNKEDIAQQNLGQDLPMLLNQLPSVVTSSDAGAGVGYTGLRVRGSDITRINVTVNGIPVNDAESQGKCRNTRSGPIALCGRPTRWGRIFCRALTCTWRARLTLKCIRTKRGCRPWR